ncbi:MAG TPA: hypothetical protein VGL86_18010, partial [Polyangia bacterium]
MRFCPFCAQDNPDDARECVHCGKRLPVLRHAPAPPKREAPKPAAPRPVPPRPQPRAPSLIPPTTASSSQRHEAFAPTALPGTLPPIKSGPVPAHVPTNGPAKSAPSDATLKPYADADETHEVTSPKSLPPTKSAPTGTLLGIPAQEIPGSEHPAPYGDSEKRTTKPLSLTDVVKRAKRGDPDFDDDAQTNVQAPATIVDDLPTSRTPRLDPEVDEHAPTSARPAPRSRPLERMTTTPALGVPTKPTVLPKTVPTQSPPAAAMPTKPTRLPSDKMPEPLPPIPSSPAMPSPRIGNEAGAFAAIDTGATPGIPTLALPPMPEHPKSGSIVDAVKYLLPLAKAIWARKKAQDAIRTLLHGDQRLLDSVLRDLGRTAREQNVSAPAIAEEMRRIAAEEERRAAAEKAVADAEASSKKEDERWHFDEGERTAELARREAELKVTDEDLRKDAELRRGHEAERAKVDVQIKAAERRAVAADAKAAKAEITPPEKGGGPNTAANARAEAAQARKE